MYLDTYYIYIIQSDLKFGTEGVSFLLSLSFSIFYEWNGTAKKKQAPNLETNENTDRPWKHAFRVKFLRTDLLYKCGEMFLKNLLQTTLAGRRSI